MTFSEEIKQYAISLGFDACGICRAHDSGEEKRYMQWLAENCQGGMGYLERNIEKRLDPRKLVDGAKSIISVALNYYPSIKQRGGVPRFAYYAYGKDYHEVMWEKLKQLFQFIQERRPGTTGRTFSDTAPVLERFWAAQAGIGFVGKNTLLIIPGKGSYFFLGEIILDRKSTRLNSSHVRISYAVFCLKKKNSQGIVDDLRIELGRAERQERSVPIERFVDARHLGQVRRAQAMDERDDAECERLERVGH